jgi:hypothetical protein
METFNDRRKQKRFSIKNRLSCVLVSPIIILSYGILDISDSGLSFSYAGWEKWPSKGIKLDIIDDNFFLKEIPFEVVSDIPLDGGATNLRRCGVKFLNLSDDQKLLLREYVGVTTN